MGCGSSKTFVIDEDVFGFDSRSKKFYERLGLSNRDLDMLFTSFFDMDSDSSGAIRIEEFLIYFEVEMNEINKKIFGIFEDDDCLSFTTYVCTLWYFLSIDTKRIGSLLYRMFDKQNDDCMSIPQIQAALKIVNQDELGNFSKIDKAIESLPTYGERRTVVTLRQFTVWSEKNQVIFMPMTKAQFILREKLIGNDFWLTQEEKREKTNELNDPLIDINLRQTISDLKFEHANFIRKKQLSNRGFQAVNKGPGRNRFTHIMVSKLNKDNMPKREKKGEVSTSGAPIGGSGGGSVKKGPPVTENRRRRSVFKPNLAPKASDGKVAPSNSSSKGGSKKKYAT